MASICPKCRAEIEDDAVCCAYLRHVWKCRTCGKRSTGFVVPYGRCFLCGGRNEVVHPYTAEDVRAARAVEEAVQFEVDMHTFYQLGRRRATDPTVRAVFEQLALKEQDHLEEIQTKYHVHLEPEVLAPPPGAEEILARSLFEGIDFCDRSGQVLPLYERALTMERRTRDHFARRAGELTAGAEREICRELAAEEEEHIAILETELAQFAAERAGA
jgi:rubrerythrin